MTNQTAGGSGVWWPLVQAAPGDISSCLTPPQQAWGCSLQSCCLHSCQKSLLWPQWQELGIWGSEEIAPLPGGLDSCTSPSPPIRMGTGLGQIRELLRGPGPTRCAVSRARRAGSLPAGCSEPCTATMIMGARGLTSVRDLRENVAGSSVPGAILPCGRWACRCPCGPHTSTWRLDVLEQEALGSARLSTPLLLL